MILTKSIQTLRSSNWFSIILIFLWLYPCRITFMIAIGLLLTGATLNDRRGQQVYKDGSIYCYVIKPGVSAVGAVLSALSSIFGVFYYQTLNSKAKDASNAPILIQGGVIVAQPQFPSENPDFVNGDAYNKQQFNCSKSFRLSKDQFSDCPSDVC